MRIIFCGGGTAGHVTPALAIAEGIVKKDKDAEILFIGRDGGAENDAVRRAGFKLETIEIYGFERRISIKNLKRLKTVIEATAKAKEIIKAFKPNVVVGTGGYVTFPVLRAARALKIPTAIHESNAACGLTTRLLAGKCDRVFLNFDGALGKRSKRKNVRVVGNPVRDSFLVRDRGPARRRLGISEKDFLILSFGGSGGAMKMNEVILSFMNEYAKGKKNIIHIHATGKKYYEATKDFRKELKKEKSRSEIRPYIDNMSELMAAADLTISRCGAMTISEISAAGCAAILIPSPNVTRNHQYKNAKHLSDNGAAVLLSEDNLTVKSLTDTVDTLIKDGEKRLEMSEKIKQFYIADSKEKIISEISKIAK